MPRDQALSKLMRDLNLETPTFTRDRSLKPKISRLRYRESNKEAKIFDKIGEYTLIGIYPEIYRIRVRKDGKGIQCSPTIINAYFERR